MRKLQFGVFVLAGALIVTIASSSLLGHGPHRRSGGAVHRARHVMPSPAGAGAAVHAGPVPVGRAPSRAAPDAAQLAVDRSTMRAVLTADLAAARRARAARLAAARRARAARRHPHPVNLRLCRRFQHVAIVGAPGTGLVVRNDNYGGRRECLGNVNRRANFAVTLSAARRAGREPVAFPNIFYGCSWGVCSPGTRLPRRLSRLRDPVTSWSTVGHPPGQWDAAYDIWFARRPLTNGQDHGVEIMLWLRANGLGRPATAHSLLIDRRRWQLEHWITRNPASGGGWPLIIFRMVHPRGSVRHLALMPFFRRVEALGLLHRSWWLTAVEAGFEVWRGGAGLRTTSFWVRL